MIEAKAYLCKRYFDAFDLNDAQQLLEQLDYRVNNFSKSHIFVVNTNPIKVACLVIEILSMVKDSFYCLNKRAERQRELVISGSLKILNKITSLDEMRQYIYDSDLDGRDLLTYIWEFQINEFLVQPLISTLVKEIWNS